MLYNLQHLIFTLTELKIKIIILLQPTYKGVTTCQAIPHLFKTLLAIQILIVATLTNFIFREKV